MKTSLELNPESLARHARQSLMAVVDSLRDGEAHVDDPKAQALFETSAEVLQGLVKAFEHYEQKSEKAWQ